MADARDAREFEQLLLGLKDKILKANGGQVRLSVLDLWNELTIETPVQTGRLRANWNISTSGTPDRTDIGAPNSPEQATAINEQKIKSSETAIDKAEVIFITNNVEYVIDVNTGTEEKPGQKFIETAIKKVFGG